jgi:predicted nucleic acid-binding protein
MAGILVDSDVLADHLRGRRRFEPRNYEVYVSAITRTELLAARHADPVPVGRVLGTFKEIAVDGTIAARAGRIRSQTGVTLADALIAATAIEHDLTLVTHNLFGFRAIDGLRATAPPTG